MRSPTPRASSGSTPTCAARSSSSRSKAWSTCRPESSAPRQQTGQGVVRRHSEIARQLLIFPDECRHLAGRDLPCPFADGPLADELSLEGQLHVARVKLPGVLFHEGKAAPFDDPGQILLAERIAGEGGDAAGGPGEVAGDLLVREEKEVLVAAVGPPRPDVLEPGAVASPPLEKGVHVLLEFIHPAHEPVMVPCRHGHVASIACNVDDTAPARQHPAQSVAFENPGRRESGDPAFLPTEDRDLEPGDHLVDVGKLQAAVRRHLIQKHLEEGGSRLWIADDEQIVRTGLVPRQGEAVVDPVPRLPESFEHGRDRPGREPEREDDQRITGPSPHLCQSSTSLFFDKTGSRELRCGCIEVKSLTGATPRDGGGW